MGKRLTRREREHLRHRNEILDAAERVFGRSSFYACSMAEIAEEAEFAVGTLYNFFEGKEELYLAVLDRMADEFLTEFDAEVKPIADPEEAVRRLAVLKLRFFSRHRGALGVFFGETLGTKFSPRAGMDKGLQAKYERYVTDLAAIFAKGVKGRAFANAEPGLLANFFEGALNAAVVSGALPDDEGEIEELAERVVQLLFWGVRKRDR